LLSLVLWPQGEDQMRPSLSVSVDVPGYANESLPSISPDGRFVAFTAGADQGRNLVIVDLSSGESHVMAERGVEFRLSRFSPDGAWLVFERGEAGLGIVSVPDGIPAVLSEDGTNPTWLDERTIAFNNASDIALVDRVTREVTTVLESGVTWTLNAVGDGRHVFVSMYDAAGPQMGIFDVKSRELTILGPGLAPRFVKPGHLLFHEVEEQTIWSDARPVLAQAIDLVRGVRTVLSSPGTINNPVWSPDGEDIYWGEHNGRNDVVLKRAVNGMAEVDTVYSLSSSPEWVTPDGRYLGIIRLTNEGLGDLQDPSQYIPIAAKENVTEVLSRISNGGNHVAYTSSETGDYKVFVQTIPPTGRSWQVSIEGGEEPLWSANDDTIYWRNGDQLFSASVSYADGVPSFGGPSVIFEGAFENVPGYSIDISPLDGRILMVRSNRVERGLNRIEMITNYPALLDQE
jgi:hypothetical protein